MEQRGRLLLCAAVFLLALALRWQGETPPFDDIYHAHRIEHFFAIGQFDPGRGERGLFTPWPPLYDGAAMVVDRLAGGTHWLPPLTFSLFSAALCWRFGWVAGVTVALSPYLIGISRAGHIDHHFLEPPLLLLIIHSTARQNGPLLGASLAMALLIQPALILAAAISFLLLFEQNPRAGLRAFAIAGAAILLYRLSRAPGYPDSAWLLGFPHAAMLGGAAVACELRLRTGRWLALGGGMAVALAVPSSLEGLRFLAGDPWLRTIVEFQPMFRDPSRIGTDLANLTGGAVLLFALFRGRHWQWALFAAIYLLLALTSRRFLIPAIPLLAICGALAASEARSRRAAAAAIAATLLPPLLYDLATWRRSLPDYSDVRDAAAFVRSLPTGRLLAPWSHGHALHVLGGKPVILDNFGSMSDSAVFANGSDALLVTRESVLLEYCRSRNVRYLVLTDPRSSLPSTAAGLGVDRAFYTGTPLAQRTVWWRLYHGTLRSPHFQRLRGDAMSVWRVQS